MCIVWVVNTKYKDGHESVNCICETEEKAKKEREFLEEKAKELLIDKDFSNSDETDIECINIQDWIVL